MAKTNTIKFRVYRDGLDITHTIEAMSFSSSDPSDFRIRTLNGRRLKGKYEVFHDGVKVFECHGRPGLE